MKYINKFYFLSIFVLHSYIVNAQKEPWINFQAIAKDQNSNLALNKNIFILTSILDKPNSNSPILVEVFKSLTDNFGMFGVAIGNGTYISGSAKGLNEIKWGNGMKYLNIKISFKSSPPGIGSPDWFDVGTTTFGAVPYALYSASTNIDTASLVNRISLLVNAGADSSIYLTTYKASQTYVKLTPQNAAVTLTGGGIFELHSPGNFSSNLSWSVLRNEAVLNQNATNNLKTIIVAGTSINFSNPTIGTSLIGNTNVSVNYNKDTSFQISVITVDNMRSSATVNYIFLPKIYIGYLSNTNPSDANIISLNGSFSGKTTTGILQPPLQPSYVCFAIPAKMGNVEISINGLYMNYNLIKRPLTNASGFTQDYNIYIAPYKTNYTINYSLN